MKGTVPSAAPFMTGHEALVHEYVKAPFFAPSVMKGPSRTSVVYRELFPRQAT